ncbi:MAG: Maf family protein [Sporomusaceae bacterium]|nr:Maf family protein [Sporomusaceae bacterium]
MIVLASASPRRRELLEQIRMPYVVVVSDVEEDNAQHMAPIDLAVLQAKQKAQAVMAKWNLTETAHQKDCIIGADTIVAANGQIYGKPKDASDAMAMLHSLAGKTHDVITGVAVLFYPGEGEAVTLLADYALTKVTFRAIDSKEIASYVATKEPLDKAGGYAIQGLGALFVEKIEGDYTNVVGLPLSVVAKLLQQTGMRLL